MLSINIDMAPFLAIVSLILASSWTLVWLTVSVPIVFAIFGLIQSSFTQAQTQVARSNGGGRRRDPFSRPFDPQATRDKLGGREHGAGGDAPKRIKRERKVDLDRKPNFSGAKMYSASVSVEGNTRRRGRSRRRRRR